MSIDPLFVFGAVMWAVVIRNTARSTRRRERLRTLHSERGLGSAVDRHQR